jgi:hypothetical protein
MLFLLGYPSALTALMSYGWGLLLGHGNSTTPTFHRMGHAHCVAATGTTRTSQRFLQETKVSDPQDDLERLLADILDDSKPLPSITQVIDSTKAEGAMASAGVHIEIEEKLPRCDWCKDETTVPTHGGRIPCPQCQPEAAPQPEVTQVCNEPASEPSVLIPIPSFTSADMAKVMDIRNFASLVTLNTSRWHAKVKDRQASRDAAHAAGAVDAAFETRKRLLVGADDTLKAIHRTIDEARAAHYEMTLPWTTTGLNDVGKRAGGRLLPNTLFFEYTQVMADKKKAMDAALNTFVPLYPQLVQQARSKLGTRFDPSEYPVASAIRSHFQLAFDFMPIPAGTDFKGLPQQQLNTLAQHLNTNTQRMMENAMQDVWVRLHKVVGHMAERLSSPDKMFHSTLVENIRDVVRLLGHLNVTSDPRIDSLRQKVEKLLCPHDAKDLREKATLRTQVAAHAQSILAEMDKIGSTP